ncbi:DUF7344 domain-containing protein [Natrarchaeobaculum sulfurireducens]|uniref:Transcriptional regulator, ArsR family n=1 Tax=Natrarchaeobaculum sulfurireducens TaxID=2044521 RepID=A0A346PV58_9EURY|nr:hypothetical protein [Natrarchaeobaculum sulfurireducens]AXR79660.1 Transcriptional regulator, ArsR family [Natrarchaeobaculum sulfurireducens]AXR83403.1 hypothetical protein AArcMg_3424 [Natrarchaeobaculum sulfurireducens]
MSLRPVATLDARKEKDALFTALGNHRRRYVLYACNQAGGATTLSDVAEQVAAWEYDKPIEELTSTERKRVYTSIQQHHLSKLEDADLLDRVGNELVATERAKNLDIYLEVVPSKTIPWPLYYLGLAMVGAASITFAHIGWFPEALSVTVVGILFAIAISLSAVVHRYDSQRLHFGSTEIPPEIGD